MKMFSSNFVLFSLLSSIEAVAFGSVSSAPQDVVYTNTLATPSVNKAYNSNYTEENAFPLCVELGLALDTFHSLPDGSSGGIMGALGSVNLGYRLPFQNEGIGLQVGGSYGAYDWNGRGVTKSTTVQQESFLTSGVFRMTPDSYGVNAGLVCDLQFNKHAGVFDQDPFLKQMRGQLGYLLFGEEEIGVWGTYGFGIAKEPYSTIAIQYRAISQVNLFWRHIFQNKGETMVWAGTPYRQSIMYYSGRPGSFIAGVSLKAPLSKSLSVVGYGMYMGPAGSSKYYEGLNYIANVCVGLTYAFGGNQVGAKPYLPIANNTNMLVDTNLNY